jgi:hypothetical protein
MSKVKRSRCAFVVIKLRIDGEDYFLMRRDLDWKDVSFIGGHAKERDNGKLERAARRELLEEVPSLRAFKLIELTPLTDEIAHGPVYSPSAGCRAEYSLRFFILKFRDSPKPVLEALGSRTPNILIRQDDMLVPRSHRVADLVSVLSGRIPGGLQSIPHSWPEDLVPFPGRRRCK